MTDMLVVVDIDPTTNKVVGSRYSDGRYIESDEPVLIKDPYFVDDGVVGVALSDKVRIHSKMRDAVRMPNGELYNFSGDVPLLSAAYALLLPRQGVVRYTNNP